MAYISFKPTDYFNTTLYTGNGSTNTIVTGVDNDMVWLKGNSVTNGEIFDTVRGATKYLSTNSDGSENSAHSDNLTAFGSTGFTLGANSANDINVNLTAYTSWNWRAGTTTGKTTSGETITPTAYSINPTSGIGMYAYTGTGANGTIAHGLSSAPKFIMVKRLDVAGNWMCGGSIVGTGLTYNNLNAVSTRYDNATVWNSTLPSSTVISIGTYGATNTNLSTYMLYAFSDVKGFARFGKFQGNASATNSPYLYTGFEPAMLIIKRVDGGDGWTLWDNKRSTYNLRNKFFTPDTNEAEQTGSTDHVVDFLSNGFKIRGSGGETNTNGGNYLYMAWAAEPIVGSNGTAGVAR
jgi:hypothetical protein